ncbi:MAG: hypothetical protein JOY80_05160 [Candidatus Dormibacteraeota bacterium]|nr:hypothetical protein [Candidatus Dormibacteraeota bacterium]
MSNSPVYVVLTTFLASAVEAIEAVTIVVGVGVNRGWRSTLIGAGAGFGVLVAVTAALGVAVVRIPIGGLRVVVGSLLLIFGLQWLTKGVRRVAARGFAGYRRAEEIPSAHLGREMDWTAFVIAFKGVLLEGLEVVFIVVSFGAAANQFGYAFIGGTGAVLIIGGLGFAVHPAVARIPRSVLQLVVGVMLTTFGTFWSLEGLGVNWPAGDASILFLVALYALTAACFITLERRRAFGLVPNA